MNQPRAQSFDMAMAIGLRLKINMLKFNVLKQKSKIVKMKYSVMDLGQF